MPRRYGTGKDVLQYNIRELIKAGYPAKQAAAIAYQWKRDDQKKKKKRKGSQR